MNAIFETFKLRAEAVSAEVHHFPRKNEALDFILHYLHDAGISDAPQAHAVWASCPSSMDLTKSNFLPGCPA